MEIGKGWFGADFMPGDDGPEKMMKEEVEKAKKDQGVYESYPDARDADPEKEGHLCEEHQDAYGICRICGRVIPGTPAAFDLLGEEPIEEE